MQPQFQGDSANYEVITNAVKAVEKIEGMTCEIGLRRGAGSVIVMEALKESNQRNRVHVAIDPYGNIEFHGSDVQGMVRMDFTNEMRDECLANMYIYTRQNRMNFLFFCMEDSEFFSRFHDGVPVYGDVKRIETKYCFVHFDGPHNVKDIITEVNFFNERMPIGAMAVFDDVQGYYDHDKIDEYVKNLGWEVHEKSPVKWSYAKRGIGVDS